MYDELKKLIELIGGDIIYVLSNENTDCLFTIGNSKKLVRYRKEGNQIISLEKSDSSKLKNVDIVSTRSEICYASLYVHDGSNKYRKNGGYVNIDLDYKIISDENEVLNREKREKIELEGFKIIDM